MWSCKNTVYLFASINNYHRFIIFDKIENNTIMRPFVPIYITMLMLL